MTGVRHGATDPRPVRWSKGTCGLLGPAITAALIGLAGCDPAADRQNLPVTPSGEQSRAGGQGETEHAAAVNHAAAPASGSTPTAPDKPPFDPVAVNGPVFVDWPAPKFVLLISGLQQGYLEPCGCAGLENQKGGLARRHSLIRDLEARSWPVVALDAGGQIRRFGRQEEIKYQMSLEALRTLGYQAVGLGAADLALPAENLLAEANGLLDDAGQSRVTSANVTLAGEETRAYRVITVGETRVGVTSVVGDAVSKRVLNSEIKITPVAEALPPVVARLSSESDVRVLLVEATVDEAKAIARQFEIFDVIAVAEGGDVPPRETIPVEGTKTQLVPLGHKGMYAAVLGYYGEAEPRWRYQRVPLDSRYGPSPEMQQLMAAYQGQLQDLGLAGLGVRPMAHPLSSKAGDPRGEFAGAASCAECHPTTHGIWSRTPHARATETLASKSVPPRQFDPECLSCHVTGWKPQDYVPYESGFVSLESTPQLAGNGCENCHGPAAQHVAAEKARGAELNLALRNRLRAELKLTRATARQTCEACHDEDNSPEFDFDRYWPKIEHKGKK